MDIRLVRVSIQPIEKLIQFDKSAVENEVPELVSRWHVLLGAKVLLLLILRVTLLQALSQKQNHALNQEYLQCSPCLLHCKIN